MNDIDTYEAGDIFAGNEIWKVLESEKAPEGLDDERLREIVHLPARLQGYLQNEMEAFRASQHYK